MGAAVYAHPRTAARNHARAEPPHRHVHGVGGNWRCGCRVRCSAAVQSVLPGHRLWRHHAAGRRGCSEASQASGGGPQGASDVLGLRSGQPAMVLRAAAEGSEGGAGRDGAGLLHCEEPLRQTAGWRGHVQCESDESRCVFQQDPVLLLRGTAPACRRGGGHAHLLLHRPQVRVRPPNAGCDGCGAVLHLLQDDGGRDGGAGGVGAAASATTRGWSGAARGGRNGCIERMIVLVKCGNTGQL
mmetsp:Transcript_22487/g.72389  ORF Transcript_22487/g.72389 Transcript_22487/m.72389 type:complete len:242 (+) Transcript_22487:60-785(+)